MVAREHFQIVLDKIDESEYTEALYEITKTNNIEVIRDKAYKICSKVIELASSNPDDFYKCLGSTKDERIADFNGMRETIKRTNDINELKYLCVVLYQNLVFESCYQYAYQLYKKGEIKDYFKLGQGMHNCFINQLREDGFLDDSDEEENDDNYEDEEDNESEKNTSNIVNFSKIKGENMDEEEEEEYLEGQIENVIDGNNFQAQLCNVIDGLESDDIDTVKGTLYWFFFEYFRLNAKLYCSKNNISEDIAKKMYRLFSGSTNMCKSETGDYVEALRIWLGEDEDNCDYDDCDCDDCDCDDCDCDDCDCDDCDCEDCDNDDYES